MTTGQTGADTDEGARRRRQDERKALVDAAWAHSAAVARHLDRVAVRARAGAGARRDVGSTPQPLAELSTLLLADATPGALLRTVLDVVLAAVPGADAAAVTLDHDGHAELAAASQQAAAQAERLQHELGTGPSQDAVRLGDAVLARALPDRRWPLFAEHATALGWAGVLSVPLVTRMGVMGALTVYARRPHQLRAEGVGIARFLADQVAVALTNARDFRREQATAAALQRSLLPMSLPEVPGLTVAAVYRPAESGINVGGDWYDVLPLPGGRVALVIGDVAGHGLAAATTMGGLRTAVRAYVLEGHPPQRVLELVDAYLQQLEPEAYATCLVLVLDPRTGRVRWCSAGHPGPLLTSAAPRGPGDVQRALAEDGRVPALGVPAPKGARGAGGEAVLRPGSRLLLFTDGLVERRGESLDEGWERLTRAEAGPAVDDLQQWCEQLVTSQLQDGDVDDDVAALAVQLAPAPVPVPLPLPGHLPADAASSSRLKVGP